MSGDKSEFLQKYLLDNYSKAIPTSAISGGSVHIGEYCEPADSINSQRKRVCEDDSDCSDPGYSLPQDAIEPKVTDKISKQRSAVAGELAGDVYTFAKQPVDDHDIRPPAKPSPKPRSRIQKQGTGDEAKKHHRPNSHSDVNHMPESESTDHLHQGSSKRLSKKVVEIEYEIASSIRSPALPSEAKPSPSKRQSSKRVDSPKHSINSAASQITSSPNHSNPSNDSSLSPTTSSVQPNANRDSVYSMSQPLGPVTNAEMLYEEPWDLKAKRLRQGQKESTESHGVPPQTRTPVYEEAWDSPARQRKLEERLSYARSLSTTSESELFHDALDSVPATKVEESATSPEVFVASNTDNHAVNPVVTDTYEDAWDLKNSILEQKIREMQVQASATYEEPWDLKKRSQQQQDLQALHRKSVEAEARRNSQEQVVRQRSSSDAFEQAWDIAHSRIPSSRGKQHSIDETKMRKSRGCNIGQRINPLIPLANQNWYHGNITRDDAEKMLRVCKEGSYIVRISSDRKSYSLSIKSAKQNIHVQIEQVALLDGSIRYILGKNSKEFCSIPEMIDYYTHHRVPLKGAEHITLLHPVECKWSSSGH